MRHFYFLIIFAFLFLGGFVFAQERDLSGVAYPVPELGNCKNQDECAAYCDKPENMGVCLDFAEANNLIPAEEIAIARKMLAAGETEGPGGCQDQAECEAYCDDISHIEECVTFAEEHDLIPPEELEDAKKVLTAIRQGIEPPNCSSKSECDIYCQAPEHAEECITFAEAAGLMPPDELEEAQKFLAAIKKGVKPPACSGREACDEYCALPENFEECIAFAEAAGFMTPEDAAMARRTGGKGPGDCRGKEACDAFCEDPANMEECVNFGEQYGFMSHEEAENARKMLAAGFTGGPGGCKGKEECDAYCNELANMEECVNFAEKMGFMSPEDAERARRMAQRGVNVMQGGPGGCKSKEECDAFCQDPANMETCIDFAVQIGEMTPEEAEQAKRAAQAGPRPGNCQNEEECKAYCEDPTHGQECIDYAVRAGFISPEEAQQMQQGPPPEEEGVMPSEGIQPGGGINPFEGRCATPEECFQYCLQNLQDPACQAIMPPEGVPIIPPEEITPPPEEITPPPTEEAPQTFFDKAKNFLADLLSAFGF